MLLPKEEMEIHEKACDYNIKNKTCLTCKNARMRDGRLQYCRVGEQMNVQHGFIIKIYPAVGCDKWEFGIPNDMRGVWGGLVWFGGLEGGGCNVELNIIVGQCILSKLCAILLPRK